MGPYCSTARDIKPRDLPFCYGEISGMTCSAVRVDVCCTRVAVCVTAGAFSYGTRAEGLVCVCQCERPAGDNPLPEANSCSPQTMLERLNE